MEKKAKHAGGRPVSDNPLCIDLKVRFTVEDAKRLDEYCKRTGTRRAIAIRDAVLQMLDTADGAHDAETDSPAV